MEPIIKIKNLKTYFKTDDGIAKAVDDVSFSLYKGETLGIVGESGCGKSVTSLSMLNLIPQPPGFYAAGEVIYDNKNIIELDEKSLRSIRGNKISMIFQEPMTSLNPVFTVGYQIEEAIITHQKIDSKSAKSKVLEMLELVSIPDPEQRINEYPHQLSGGMRQRIMIAMALCTNPEILIADEPTTALDVTIQAQILELLDSLQKKLNLSIVMITHDLGVIYEICDRVIVMYAGQIVEQGSVENIFQNSMHPYTKALMNSMPRLNSKNNRLKTLKGMVPSIINMGDGCKLCSRFEPQDCACGGTGQNQDIIEVSENHFVRCNPDILI